MPLAILALVILWQQPATLEIGNPQQGSITESSPEVHTEILDANYTNDVTRGAAFQFSATHSGPHCFDLSSPAFDAYLVLFASDGTILAEDDDSFFATHSRIIWELESGKSYQLQACALHGQIGSFTLNLQLGQPIPRTEAQYQELQIESKLERISYLEGLHGPRTLGLSDEIIKLGVLYFNQGNYPDAISAFQRVYEIRVEEGDSKYPNVYRAVSNLANTYLAAGNYQEALLHEEKGLALCLEVLAEGHPGIANCQMKIGDIQVAMGMNAEALEQYKNAYEGFKLASEEYDQEKVYTLEAYAEQLSYLGENEQALARWQEALELRRQVFPPGSFYIANGLSKLGVAYSNFGEFQKAKQYLLEALQIREEIEGPNGEKVCIELFNLAGILVQMGEFDEALKLYQRGMGIAEVAYPPTTSEYAVYHNNFGGFLQTIGHLEEALAELEKALVVAIKQNGEQHILVLIIKSRIAATHYEMESDFDVETAFQENLRGFENHYGLHHPALIDKILNLATLLKSKGKMQQAEGLLRRALGIAEQAFGVNHFETARSLDSLADLLADLDRFEEARILYSRALSIYKLALGEKHPDVADVMMELAGIHYLNGEYEIALDLYQRAVAIMESSLGAQHHRTATAYANFGLFLENNGNAVEGKSYYRKALESMRQNGRASIGQAAVLNNLAFTLAIEGQLQEARELAEQGLEIALRLGGENHRYSSYAMVILAGILADQGDIIEAEKLLRRSLALREKILGPEHSDVALTRSELARVLDRQGKREEAILLDIKALDIRSRVFGEDHHLTAESIQNLAARYGAQGDYETQLEMLLRAHRIFTEALGANAHNSLVVLIKLGKCRAALGQEEQARALFEQAAAGLKELYGELHPHTIYAQNKLAIQHYILGSRQDGLRLSIRVLENSLKYLDSELPTMSEAGRLRMLASNGDPYYILVGLVDTQASIQPEHFDLYLRWKGKATRLQAASLKIRQGKGDPELRGLIGKLQVASKSLASMVLLPASEQPPDHAEKIATLRGQRLILERRINASAGLDHFLLTPTTQQIQQAMPADSVLVDFYADKEVFAWVLGTSGPPQLIDLGSGETLRELQRAFLSARAVRGGRKLGEDDADPVAALVEKLWLPLADAIGDAKTVFLSPDDYLCELPFGILQLADGSYLLEKHRFNYISDSTRLVRDEQIEKEAEGSLLAVGGVNYFRRDDVKAPSKERVSTRSRVGSSWSSLPATREEMQSLRDLHEYILEWKSPLSVIEGKAATEERVRAEMPGKRYVHIATHGYFEPDHLPSLVLNAQENQSQAQLGEQIQAVGLLPGLLSGLVFAGVNGDPDPSRDDGYLSAEEIQHLDLSACDLVVLSACETALGSSRAGEGLMSLRRAFSVAGAASVISSLWKVDDLATAELMKDFYTNLWEKGMSRSDALHEAKLRMLRRNRLEENDAKPSTWGAFVLSGDWN